MNVAEEKTRSPWMDVDVAQAQPLDGDDSVPVFSDRGPVTTA